MRSIHLLLLVPIPLSSWILLCLEDCMSARKLRNLVLSSFLMDVIEDDANEKDLAWQLLSKINDAAWPLVERVGDNSGVAVGVVDVDVDVRSVDINDDNVVGKL